MNIEDAFKLRKLLRGMDNKSLSYVISNILHGEYDRHKDAEEVAIDDVKFLTEENKT